MSINKIEFESRYYDINYKRIVQLHVKIQNITILQCIQLQFLVSSRDIIHTLYPDKLNENTKLPQWENQQ